MKRLINNRKGYMLVEIIVASVISFAMAYFLIDITLKLVNKNDDYYVESKILFDKSSITKVIMDDINSNLLVGIYDLKNESTEKYIILEFSDGTNTGYKKIEIKGNTINYYNTDTLEYSVTLSNKLTIGEITLGKENNTLSISIPVYSNYSNEDYGINILVNYKENQVPDLPSLYAWNKYEITEKELYVWAYYGEVSECSCDSTSGTNGHKELSCDQMGNTTYPCLLDGKKYLSDRSDCYHCIYYNAGNSYYSLDDSCKDSVSSVCTNGQDYNDIDGELKRGYYYQGTSDKKLIVKDENNSLGIVYSSNETEYPENGYPKDSEGNAKADTDGKIYWYEKITTDNDN